MNVIDRVAVLMEFTIRPGGQNNQMVKVETNNIKILEEFMLSRLRSWEDSYLNWDQKSNFLAEN